jgi:hypothetical protein
MISLFRLRLVKCDCLLAGLLFLAVTSSAQDAANVFLKGPYLQGPGTDRMTIKWEAPLNKPGFLHYGLNGATDQAFPVETPHPLNVVSNSVTNVFYLYEARHVLGRS